MHNYTGWPPPAPKVVAENSVDDWDYAHTQHTWQPEAREWSTGWEVLEGEEVFEGEGEGQELSTTGVNESGNITGQTLSDLPPPESTGGKPRAAGKRPVIAAKKEKMWLEKLARPVLSEEEEAARWSKAAEEKRAAKKEKRRLDKLAESAAAEELKSAKKKKRRLKQRAKWAMLEGQAGEPGATRVAEVIKEKEQGWVQCEEIAASQGRDAVVTREGEGERGQVEERQGETKAEVEVEVEAGAKAGTEHHKAKRYRKAGKFGAVWCSTAWDYKENHRTPFRPRRLPAFQNARPPIPQPLHKKTHRGHRARHERKPRDPFFKFDYWHIPTPTVEPTRLQKYIASRPHDEVERWMHEKAGRQVKLKGAQWQPRRRLSPTALDGVRALHKNQPEYTTKKLSEVFNVSGEVIRRVLKSRWEPDEATKVARMEHWVRRGRRVFERSQKLGLVQTKGARKQVMDRWRERKAKWGTPEDRIGDDKFNAAILKRIV